ncbi:MAG TPA: HNH endonuclease family protein [Mycobacterium sp.]|nr:HNH endonuclease family protein [Mycobacterium sp.]
MGRAIPASLALVAIAVAVAVVVGTVGWPRVHPGPQQPAPPNSGQTPRAGTGTLRYDQASADAQRLPVKGWDLTSDFARSRFGEAWSDDVDVEFGHNGCNTRDDVLRRDLADLVVRPGTCFVQSGTLLDPYGNESIEFVRGPDTSNAVQIDHVVSLSDAWYKGARDWDDRRRSDFANDPRNLLAVGGGDNFDKAFRDAARWLPPNLAFRCEFVARQVAVKTAYRLWVSAQEKRAMQEVLAGC